MKDSCEIVAPVFEKYKNNLTRFIKSRVKDPIESEELLSNVMMKIYDNCEKINGIKSIEGWLITVARNAVNDYFRQQKHTNEIFVSDLLDSEDKEETEFYDSLSECVPDLINKLPEKYSIPLALYELNGIPQKQLAVDFDMSESGLKSRIQRGRKMLKELFTEYCGELLLDQQNGCDLCKC